MRRLFYVAVTRAKSDVVFVCNDEAQNRGFVTCLREALVPGAFPIAVEKIEPLAGGERKRRRLLDASLESRLATGEIEPLTIATPSERERANDVARRRAGMKSRDAGILLHRVLERWDGTAPVEPLLTALASELAADAATLARVRQRLAVVAQSPTWRRIAAAETLGRELPLLTGSVNVIDRLIRENGRELVIDYKSGEPAPERLELDREQVARYCEAVSRITGRGCGGALWYIDDENDRWVEVLSAGC